MTEEEIQKAIDIIQHTDAEIDRLVQEKKSLQQKMNEHCKHTRVVNRYDITTPIGSVYQCLDCLNVPVRPFPNSDGRLTR
ncbi:MAG: hypothetical protein EOP45_15805 [Sphingobacteriaceae bacterium]|nr:MAG: hypothetical protein EOP45_15805 [Sphingobacteriaceae bacterium]